MAPVFTAITEIAYHCDIPAHSFLVRGAAGAHEFSLLDFGLAVRAPSWTSEYVTGTICGDPCNLSPAAWMLMIYGLGHLEALPNASLLRQHAQRSDRFSFGVVVLVVLLALWKGPEEEDVGGPQDTRVQALTRDLVGVACLLARSHGFLPVVSHRGRTRNPAVACGQQCRHGIVNSCLWSIYPWGSDPYSHRGCGPDATPFAPPPLAT